ncbi:DUF3466 family protein [Colwellia hornerae]|uniref:DUF3466 family protein n=1 Tax=Colwellia hornerae TaxID=89402 RepID=A0A5C6Q2X2_9GAMM|nr:DUF3466 family protein [Colwellia hornerae]TWX46351.1 DUF3466 family protein [Colwellia hornerae]TWX53915.1 DUF3466 family protein [Colwellia hornerae]TWX63037.1 DUF3466 family protein [Colwellia hornerae]
MNKFVKSVLVLGISSALSLSMAQAAKYEVIDKGGIDIVKYSYAQQENNQSQMAISGSDIYNFPVQFQYFDTDDFDSIVRLASSQHENVDALSDIENENDLRSGNPSANDLAWAVRYLKSQNSSRSARFYQQVGNILAMRNLTGNAGDTESFAVFDQYFPDTTILTRSTVDYVNGITNDGWIYGNGSAPYTAMPFTGTDGNPVVYWVRDFTSRAFYSPDAGNTIIALKPPTEGDDIPESLRLGGESAILDISESLFAVGYASTSIDQNSLDDITNESGGCADPEILANVPFEICIQSVVSSMYNTEAFKWTLSLEGVTKAETLGHLVTPNVDDPREFVNYAQAINNDGVAVGFAHGWEDKNETAPSRNEPRNFYGVVYKNGQVKDFTDNHVKFFDSRTYGINNAGIAIGHTKTVVNGSTRTKFFHVDTNDFDSGMEMIRPDDFFKGSSSTARAINENGIIVGEGEVETHNDLKSPRRRHAFMYDIASKTFTDLNDLLTCDSAYTIIEARDINDKNEISASALVKAPRRDAKGELIFDLNTGEQLVEDVVRAVTLRPLAGEIDDCSGVEKKVERSGAGLGFISFFALLIFGFTRRVLKKS